MPNPEKSPDNSKGGNSKTSIVSKDKVIVSSSSSIDHPDPCWIVVSQIGKMIFVHRQKEVPVFSTEDKAKGFIEAMKLKNVVPRQYSWDDFAKKYGGQYPQVFVDYDGKTRQHCRTIPIRG